jgi:hypothetical protein
MHRNYVVFGDISTCSASSAPNAAAGASITFTGCLMKKHGRKGNMMKWKELLDSDCPRRDAHSLQERCDLVCRDLPKVL